MTTQKECVKGVFNRSAADYGSLECDFFNHFGKRLVELSDLRTGHSVLDVATGRGALLFPAADRVGPSGHITGIDLSPQMLEETTKHIAAFPQIKLREMDAESLEFSDNTFDVILCGFALFFFPHLEKALAEFKRVLRPGGKLAVSTWGPKVGLAQWISEEAKRRGAENKLCTHYLQDASSLKRALEQAGFHKVTVTTETTTFYHSSPEAWWASLWAHGTRCSFEQLSITALQDIQKHALEKATFQTSPDGVPQPLTVNYALSIN